MNIPDELIETIAPAPIRGQGAPCTTCSHPQRDEINADLRNPNVTLKDIEAKYGITTYKLNNHKTAHLNLKRVGEKALAIIDQNFDFATEQHKLYREAYKMLDALIEWMSDPDHPEKFNVGARATELEIVYSDYNDLNENGAPTRKKAMLDDILHDLHVEHKMKAVRVTTKVIDRRKLFLDTLDSITKRLEQMGKFYGVFVKERENPADASAKWNQAIRMFIASGGATDAADARKKLTALGFDDKDYIDAEIVEEETENEDQDAVASDEGNE